MGMLGGPWPSAYNIYFVNDPLSAIDKPATFHPFQVQITRAPLARYRVARSATRL